MDKFDEIRPYNDDEVHQVIENIINDDEFFTALINLKLSRLPEFLRRILKPIFRFVVRRQVRDINSVFDFQRKVASYMEHMIETTMTQFTVSGLEKLDINEPYLFISNHRDITLDPAFVNYALYLQGGNTVRIAIGDNLLTKEFATHLMRINKSFIVKRSEKAPRKLLASLKLLSEYIHHSLTEDKHSIWIAQREGRAKDGLDRTDSAIIKMFAINEGRKGNFAEFMRSLKIVPVSISYEYDPCDLLKARELYALKHEGKYIKGEQEDIASIAKGITGYKGHVHLTFGEVLTDSFETAEEVSSWLDKKIIDNYVLHPSNYFAYERLYGEFPEGVYSNRKIPFNAPAMSKEKRQFDEHIETIPEEYRSHVLNAYANPIVSRQAFALR